MNTYQAIFVDDSSLEKRIQISGGLYSYGKFVTWQDNEPDVVNTLLSLTGNDWNDNKDTNGWQLNG